jgi:hypothetical protein
MASETLIVVGPDRACVNEIIDGRTINRTVVIPSVVQLYQHVGLRSVVTDCAHKTALRCFGASECVEADGRVAVFDRDAFGRGKARANAQFYE